MRYDTVAELEAIGRAGAKLLQGDGKMAARYLSSFWLYIEPEDRAFSIHWPTGYWESWVSAWLSQQWDDTDLFIDVGANVGYFTMQAAIAGVRTMSIEPNPDLYKMVWESAKINKVTHKIEMVNVALSDHQGRGTLWVPEFHSGGATIESAFEGFDVEINTVDNILNRTFLHKQRRVLFKIDAEGAEPKIWAGMQETLKAYDQSTVLLEWHGVRYDRQAFAEELSKHHLTLIQHDGTEMPIDYDWLMAEENLHMICVRPIKENL